jgi:hypothetical protein
VDESAPDNLRNISAAGLRPDVYLFPCPGKNPAQQVNEMIDYLRDNDADIYDTIWVDVETNPSKNCGWS